MTENLRKARATDDYVLRGDPAGETFTPRFTFHGFQYVEVTGYPGKPDSEAITGHRAALRHSADEPFRVFRPNGQPDFSEHRLDAAGEFP